MTTQNPFDTNPMELVTGEATEGFGTEPVDRAAEAFAASLQIVKRDRIEERFLATADATRLAQMAVVAEGTIPLGGADHQYDITADGLGTFRAGYAGPALSLRSVGGERRLARRKVVWGDTREEMRLRTQLTPKRLFSDPNLTALDLGREFMAALAGTVAIGAATSSIIAGTTARSRVQWFADAAAAFVSLATLSPVSVSWRLPCRPDRQTTGWGGGVALTGPGCARIDVENDGSAARGVGAVAERMLEDIAAGLDIWAYELQLVGGYAIRQAVSVECFCPAATGEDAQKTEAIRSLIERAIGLHGGTAASALRHIALEAGHA